jgi:hypothetical protein
MSCRPLLVRRYGLVDRPEKVPDPGLTEEVKLTLRVAAASSVQPALTTGGAPAEYYGVARNTAVAAVVLYQAVGLLVPLVGGGLA